ncbi:type VI secretion system baseplate subunit TssG [Paraburkholderia azotifigens]|uniref:Type VI secretion system baseplate subunit TssG n=1 Tax=Paraburkholderia azotifigens TaxID=2057004 RepID=A0A5C6VN22_9BURK|nr:type VI secretion system baseplate subunit TssG [Paraburkholderia azotifigens]TXC84568.1 type VI secretion system baseplate subunit TssG [Paraburkholderia azotifigens]
MEAMGADDGLPAAALIARLKANPQSFDLFQAISLLERAAPWARPLGRGNGLGEAVRFVGHVSLAFEPSDIRSVREHAGSPDGEHVDAADEHEQTSRERHGAHDMHASYTVTTPVLTLAGANGPLPMAYTELVLARRAQRDTATADLLDIFNHRFLSFLYRSRKKHAPGLNWRSPHGSALAAALDALSNLGLRAGANGPNHGPHGERLWMRHAGLLGAAPRSMTGLCTLLADRLGLKVRGAQFVGGWREIDVADSLRLARAGSRAPRLGGAAVLGRRTWDEANGICIEFPELTKARFEALLPGGRDHAMAAWLIRSYLQQDFDVQFVLHLVPQRVDCAAGGLRAARLGWTSWLGGTNNDTHTPKPVRLAMREAAVPAPMNL